MTSLLHYFTLYYTWALGGTRHCRAWQTKTYSEQMEALPGAETTDKLHKEGSVVIGHTAIYIHTNFIDTVDKL